MVLSNKQTEGKYQMLRDNAKFLNFIISELDPWELDDVLFGLLSELRKFCDDDPDVEKVSIPGLTESFYSFVIGDKQVMFYHDGELHQDYMSIVHFEHSNKLKQNFQEFIDQTLEDMREELTEI